jgi:hypothetical protein
MGSKISLIILAAVTVFCIFQSVRSAHNEGISITGFSIGSEFHQSPSDMIKDGMIFSDDESVSIRVPNAVIGRVGNTNSMSPLLDNGSNTIMVAPKNPEGLKEGDIVAYYSSDAKGLVVHRIVSIGGDEKGWFSITKGDNAPSADPGKVRFSSIEYVVVGILY